MSEQAFAGLGGFQDGVADVRVDRFGPNFAYSITENRAADYGGYGFNPDFYRRPVAPFRPYPYAGVVPVADDLGRGLLPFGGYEDQGYYPIGGFGYPAGPVLAA